MKSTLSLLLIALILIPNAGVTQEKKDQKKIAISFSKDVMPLMKKRCLPCHASDSDNPSKLCLESYGDLMKGGKHGSPVIAGKGSESILVKKLQPNHPFGDQMPLMRKTKLTDEEIAVFEKWIDQGAKKN
jgi:uncharacterized membrane protein